MHEYGQRFSFAVFAFALRKIFSARLILPLEEDGGLGKCPAQGDVADLLARGPQPFAIRLFGAFH